MTEKIAHEEISVYGDKDENGQLVTHFGEHDVQLSNLEAYFDYALLTAAAAVYNMTGSLNQVASMLGWVGFQVPLGYEAEDEKYAYSGREALSFWVEENRERIMDLVDSTPAKTIASGDMYE